MKQITGNKLLVKALKEEGVEYLFGYPGACTIDISDELYKQDEIKIVLPRHEQALVHEADAYARTTGKVGVCLVTSGPGATNLVTGLATANYDSVPLVCFTGQVARHLIGNDAFQEVDIVGITRSITKYGVTVRNREDLGRIIKEAFYIARTGKPGPVLIDLPKDVMAELGSAEYPKNVNIRGYKPNTSVHIGQLKRALKMLAKAKRPLFLAGGGVNIAHAQEVFREVVEKTQVPVVTTVMGRGAISTKHPLFIGNLGMHGAYAANMAVSECDLLFSIGTRFNDRITGKLHEFAPHAQIVHIDIDTASISRNIHVDIPIVADAKEAITKIAEYVEPCSTSKWLAQIDAWKNEHPLTMRPNGVMGPLDIFNAINEQFDDAIIVTDVGQHQMLTSQYVDITENRQIIMSGGLGTMGYGLGAAIGAQVANPDKQVVFLGVGFETTAPGTAAAALTAAEQRVENFSLWSMLKTVEPALRALMAMPDFNIDGFICPGHVATIIGVKGFRFLPEEYSMPAVIAGFEPEDILRAVYRLAKQIAEQSPKIENEYRRAVTENGNPLAQNMMNTCLRRRPDNWRGLGLIPDSGLEPAAVLERLDAELFGIKYAEKPKPTACRCGDVICGRIAPEQCPMFGGRCTPEDPVGPCMVSSEGACAAAYKYAGV